MKWIGVAGASISILALLGNMLTSIMFLPALKILMLLASVGLSIGAVALVSKLYGDEFGLVAGAAIIFLVIVGVGAL